MFVSSAAGGAFFVAWMIVGFIYIVPTHLSTALFAIGAGRVDELRDRLRFSIKLAITIGLIGVPVVFLGGGRALHIFGMSYASRATWALRLLALSYFPMIVKTHYVAVVRVQQKLARGSVVVLVGAALEVAGAATGAVAAGLDGLALGYIAGLLIETAYMSVIVAQTAQHGGSAPKPDPGTATGSEVIPPGAAI